MRYTMASQYRWPSPRVKTRGTGIDRDKRPVRLGADTIYLASDSCHSGVSKTDVPGGIARHSALVSASWARPSGFTTSMNGGGSP
jgi:hypothetical protein